MLMSDGTAPLADQIEVSLFGPGFGECVVLHIGGGEWVVVDSCADRGKSESIVLDYFKAIGVEPDQIVLIVASHWHSDHTKGLSSLVASAPNAQFCCAMALSSEEFLRFASVYENVQFEAGSGVDEILNAFRALEKRKSHPVWAVKSRQLLRNRGLNQEVDVWSLSPSDGQITQFLRDIASGLPGHGEALKRAQSRNANDLTIVLQVLAGNTSILLGGDLEQTRDPVRGWQAVVTCDSRPPVQSAIFKVPHHGAPNGHNQDVWDGMLVSPKIGIVAPYSRGVTPRPSPDDCARLLSLTDNAYLTSNSHLAQKRKKRDRFVEKQLKARSKQIRRIDPPMGHIRIRHKIGSPVNASDVELFGAALKL